MEPIRMRAMEDPRPLVKGECSVSDVLLKGVYADAHVVMMSPKNQTATSDCTTPRTAEETMCVIGEVILMLRKPAMPMRKPKTPWGDDNTSLDAAKETEWGQDVP